MTPSLKGRIAVGLVLVFLAGVATGIFAGAWHARHVFVFRHGEMVGDRMREHLKRELGLTPEQLVLVEPILNQTAERLHAIRTETTQRVTEAMEESHRQLLPHLTPEQQAKIEKMKERHLRMLHHHGERPEPPPDE
jgi:hypothetical protein